MDGKHSKAIWTIKGATLSDKNARKEFGISQEEIIEGIKAGKLQYRVNYIHGNPYYKLIKEEVESYITEKYGQNFLEKTKIEFRLKQITTELRKLKRQMNALQKEKNQLQEQIDKM
ncbi:MAG: hypothetical protein AAF806_31730 [Bacteroidota bacterium]